VVEQHSVFSGSPTDATGKPNSSGHIVQFTNSEAYGGCWIGQTQYITHVVKDSENLGTFSGTYEKMTLADAVDYTRFLVSFTCDYQRFATMVPNCARPITSAMLTPEGYEERLIE